MKAVELNNRRTHWVYDDHRTLCGRPLIDLPVAREIDVDNLPGDPCRACRDLANSGFGMVPAGRITLPPSHGVLRKTGPISHGPRSTRRGQKLHGSD